jgi:ketosteroid isomerase-like protein
MTGIKNIAVSLYSCADAKQQGMLVTSGYGVSEPADGAMTAAPQMQKSTEPATPTPVAGTDAAAHQAHEAYLSAINSNSLQSLLAIVTNDVVFLSPNEPVLVGKDAVRAWSQEYLKVFTIHWDKAVSEFTVAGEWAFERYSYKQNDKPRGGGASVTDTGKGLIIYHRDADGKWRVARDAWNSDLPLPAK